MSETTDEALIRESQKPHSVAIPGMTVTRHSLRDQIELDKHLSRKRASKSKLGGVKMLKSCPPPMG